MRATAARITLRPATRADLPQIEPWYAEAAALAHTDATPEQRFAANKASKRELLIIARADDPAPIGLLDYRLGFPDKGWLAIDLIVLAAGRRGWGYGSEAVRLVEESSGAKRFLAEVDARSGLALYFWLRLGYRPAHAGEVFWRAPDEDGIIAMVRDGTQGARAVDDIFRHIDEHHEEAIAKLVELCSFPTVSAQGRAIKETADWVTNELKALGFEVQLLPKPEGPPAQPVVYAHAKGTSAKTLLFYDHYDVQPEEPLDLWKTPPFEPVRKDGKLYGRGVSDNKGNIAARLAAIRAWRETRGELPCGVKFCIEGDEEIGSPHMEAFVERHKDLLAADACIWEGGGVTWEGLPQITLGVKGLLYVQLECESISRDAHSSYGTVLPNAAWRLVWALSSIKGMDERVLIDGFYDDVRPPTPDERAALEKMPHDELETAKTYGIESFLGGVRGLDYGLRHYFQPTATIDGLSSGYEGEGPKTVLPARAMAKIDFRLVNDQDPQDIERKLRAHLDRQGFGDITIKNHGGEHPARTPVGDPFVAVMRDAVKQAYGAEPLIVPTMAGTGPLYPFVTTLGLPTADCGIGYPDAAIHAPNENIRTEDFRAGTKAIAALLDRFGQEQ